jgi:hypothetical protein
MRLPQFLFTFHLIFMMTLHVRSSHEGPHIIYHLEMWKLRLRDARLAIQNHQVWWFILQAFIKPWSASGPELEAWGCRHEQATYTDMGAAHRWQSQHISQLASSVLRSQMIS